MTKFLKSKICNKVLDENIAIFEDNLILLKDKHISCAKISKKKIYYTKITKKLQDV